MGGSFIPKPGERVIDVALTEVRPIVDLGAESQLSDVGSNDDLYDEFLEALAALGGSAGNGRLRDVLELDEATYDAVKSELLSRGLIVPGRSRG